MKWTTVPVVLRREEESDGYVHEDSFSPPYNEPFFIFIVVVIVVSTVCCYFLVVFFFSVRISIVGLDTIGIVCHLLRALSIDHSQYTKYNERWHGMNECRRVWWVKT